MEGLKAPGPEALYHGEEAVRLALALSGGELLVRSLINLAAARFQAGQYTLARATYQEVQELLAGKPRLLPGGAVLVLHGLAHMELVAGTPQRALQHLEASARLCRMRHLRGTLPAALGTGRRDVADLVRSRLAPLLDRGL